ncbi:primosomal protein N' [Candidatus Saccharibacteria bacterium]|nr:primosomal protein N' [Candidatus Saccharibacteria bacterium]
MFYEVIVGKMFGKSEVLTYAADSSLLPGQIVEVPLGRGRAIGVINKKVAQPDFTTKKILKVLYSMPLPTHLLATVRFVAEYYRVPLASTLGLILPKGVEKKRRKTEQMFGSSEKTEHSINTPQIPLNQAQKKALEALQQAPGPTKLLHGVTGSGKTNIYLKMAKNALLRQKSTILLVPEIALTGQLVRVFAKYFGGKVVLLHSQQTEAERHLIFNSLLSSDDPKIVIGPRSALFAPLSNLGLIIIDEEHEGTYRQENTPKYSAIRVASFMAGKLGIDLVLGSATPVVEDYYLADKKDAVVTLAEKAKSTAIAPEIKIVDSKNRDNFSKNRYFSNALLAAIKNNLEQGRQTLIFHNRRGSSPLTICENCGEEIICPNCYLPLTLHADNYELACHTCGYRERVPMTCPKCGTPDLVHKGFGTKLLESELKKLFPGARIKRFDADNKKGEGLDAVYSEVRDGEVDILVGTQTLAKGLDLPRLATVGVAQADAGLNLPDFMAEERTFQLITQVIGRVGRGHSDQAEVFIQTFRPDNPVIQLAAAVDYQGFYEYTIEKRRRAGLPPFMFVAKLEITMKTEATVLKKVREAAKMLGEDKRLIVSPPMPAFHERNSRGYTWQIVVRARSRKALVEACAGLDPNFRVTFDPATLL